MAQYPAAGTVVKFPVTKSNTAGEASLGSSTLAGAGAATYTSYVQIAASLSSDTVVTRVTLSIASGNFATAYVDVAYGGAGSEIVLATVPLVSDGFSTAHGIAELRFPVRVASGQRLAVRYKNSASLSAITTTVEAFGAPYANLEGN